MSIERIDQAVHQRSLRRMVSGSRLRTRRERRRRVCGPWSGSAGSTPSPASEPRPSTPHPRAGRDGHCSPGLRHQGWNPTAVNRRPPFGPGQIQASDLRERQFLVVGNSSVARPGWVIRSRWSQIGTPTDSLGAPKDCAQQTHRGDSVWRRREFARTDRRQVERPST